MTPLRSKFISSLELQNYSENTIKQYTRCVAHVAAFYGKCPSLLGPSEIENYLIYLKNKKHMGVSSHRQYVAAFRYLYQHVLGQCWKIPRIPYPRRNKPLRDFLTPQEVKIFLEAVANPKHRMMLEVIYATGVRGGELVKLRLSDIDSRRKVVVVQDGKGHKGRLTILSHSLLLKLRSYYKTYRPRVWLFEGRRGPIDVAVAQRACALATIKSGIGKKVTPHVLRRSFTTALHEQKVDVITMSRLLGHASVKTTELYTEVSLKTLHQTICPLDLL